MPRKRETQGTAYKHRGTAKRHVGALKSRKLHKPKSRICSFIAHDRVSALRRNRSTLPERKVERMISEASFIDLALRSWKANIDRADIFFDALSEEELQREVAPGKNRLIYLWGHLTAVNDRMVAILGLGDRLHPELDAMFVSNPDKTVHLTLSPEKLKHLWDEVNERLWAAFCKLSPSDWMQKHAAVSEEDFVREPHRNRFSVLLGRTAHLAYHLGQAVLAKRES